MLAVRECFDEPPAVEHCCPLGETALWREYVEGLTRKPSVVVSRESMNGMAFRH